MYTLGKVLELVNAGDDIYCKLYETDGYITEGIVSDLLDMDTRIGMYGLESDEYGDYLLLYLA